MDALVLQTADSTKIVAGASILMICLTVGAGKIFSFFSFSFSSGKVCPHHS